MRNRVTTLMFGVVVFGCLAVIPAQSAQQTGAGNKVVPRTADGKPDLSGFWARAGGGIGFNAPRPKDAPPGFDFWHQGQLAPMELTPWAKEQLLYNLDPLNKEIGETRVMGRAELDPMILCFPLGAYRLGLPQMIVQIPGKIFFVYQSNHEMRQIFMDGRKHPEDLDPTWNGHSIGTWDGDTLVVDTVGMREETWLDFGGHVHSADMRLVERIRRIDHDTLEWETTLTDPKVFVKPFIERGSLKWRADYDFTEDINCEQRYRKGLGLY